MYLYEGHLHGNIYATSKYVEPVFCDICDDIDDYLGEFYSVNEISNFLKNHFGINITKIKSIEILAQEIIDEMEQNND